MYRYNVNLLTNQMQILMKYHTAITGNHAACKLSCMMSISSPRGQQAADRQVVFHQVTEDSSLDYRFNFPSISGGKYDEVVYGTCASRSV